MAKATIVLIERPGIDRQSFGPSLERKGYHVHSIPSGKLAIKYARKEKPEVMILDAASLGTSGNRICQEIRAQLNGVPIIHIRDQQHAIGDERGGPGDISLDMPFTVRKLVNRIQGLLPDDKDLIIEGPVRFYRKQRIVRAYGREKKLTPKLARLLELFLRHPDKTLDRTFLMKKVWDTDFIGDTRTLDVHMRWLRQAIERRPAKPRHILTMRGQGYVFVPDPAAATARQTQKAAPHKRTASSSKKKL